MTDINRKLDLIRTITKNVVNSIKFDLEIAQDNSKYTTYLLGISSTGLGVSLFNIKNISGSNLFFNETTIYCFLIFAMIVFIISIIIGIWTKRCVLKGVTFMRISMSLVLLQEVCVLSMKEIKDDLDVVRSKAVQFLYLNEEKQIRMKETEVGNLGLSNEKHLIITHVILLGIGFLLVIISIIPKLPL
jgi:hypothetical protein